jgi:hypothetical protein
VVRYFLNNPRTMSQKIVPKFVLNFISFRFLFFHSVLIQFEFTSFLNVVKIICFNNSSIKIVLLCQV